MNLKAYQAAQLRHPYMLLLFRTSEGYQICGAAAERAARLLGLPLTVQLDPASQKQVFVTGFSYHKLESCLRELLTAGERVAVCEPVEETPVDPPAAQTRPTLFDHVARGGKPIEG